MLADAKASATLPLMLCDNSQMSETSLNTYHHGDLRQALLDRAAEVIQQSGIEALTLRGLARDLGVSHGAPNRHFKSKAALLSTLAAEGYTRLTSATLQAADDVGSDDPWVRLNAMGRGYMHWALDNPASFYAISHPDLIHYEDEDFHQAMGEFSQTVRQATQAAQDAGRHPYIDLDVLELYTNSVPAGAARMLSHQMTRAGADGNFDKDKLVADIIELVVPIAGRE